MNRPLRIIVADDDPDLREYYRSVLTCRGHTVVALACDGRELVERCRALHPDLVITDLHMPGMDGLEAAARIGREMPAPIILMCTTCPDDRGRDGGEIVTCLVKPFQTTDLEAAIERASGRSPGADPRHEPSEPRLPHVPAVAVRRRALEALRVSRPEAVASSSSDVVALTRDSPWNG